ncbi:putative nicotinate-nucleotide adenylyltransferase [Capnocytophaga catalasegens]|uniref:Probable nicotinate-nucleotide adenylyltransferase n=2 Tax=Capnocytophaga catalasegens TaxID=1004260 RepID=A0AAV5AZE7_9FLAO|nr:putative nicotinate-nucleotide adenylyltransferase [Capnocytophaga catalasegens]GJM50538.1 putative nicotinate-nucleotide adenylyltransferase [Capnocytophaga catalasegens]GJM53217.1 putative nicotinate-nucleotide adenylyltransferase [Capnocytophaga catalasegens]
MKKIGLYFGSFNPIHIGHIIIANHLVEHSDMDEIWFVVTPLSPFKQKVNLLENHHRLEMVYRAVKKYDKLRESDIEFRLPEPNYTINTLTYLEEKYPKTHFCLIMGEDNLKSFPKWKNYQVLLERYDIYVYPRISQEEIPIELLHHPRIKRVNAPIIELSATLVRDEIAQGKNVRPLLDPDVWKYIDEMGFYLKNYS